MGNTKYEYLYLLSTNKARPIVFVEIALIFSQKRNGWIIRHTCREPSIIYMVLIEREALPSKSKYAASKTIPIYGDGCVCVCVPTLRALETFYLVEIVKCSRSTFVFSLVLKSWLKSIACGHCLVLPDVCCDNLPFCPFVVWTWSNGNTKYEHSCLLSSSMLWPRLDAWYTHSLCVWRTRCSSG